MLVSLVEDVARNDFRIGWRRWAGWWWAAGLYSLSWRFELLIGVIWCFLLILAKCQLMNTLLMVLQVLITFETRSTYAADSSPFRVSEPVSLHVGLLLKELVTDIACVWLARGLSQMTCEFSSATNKDLLALVACDLCKRVKRGDYTLLLKIQRPSQLTFFVDFSFAITNRSNHWRNEVIHQMQAIHFIASASISTRFLLQAN